jgi:hypothetical protein
MRGDSSLLSPRFVIQLFLFRPPCAPKPAVLDNTINNGNEGTTLNIWLINEAYRRTEKQKMARDEDYMGYKRLMTLRRRLSKLQTLDEVHAGCRWRIWRRYFSVYRAIAAQHHQNFERFRRQCVARSPSPCEMILTFSSYWGRRPLDRFPAAPRNFPPAVARTCDHRTFPCVASRRAGVGRLLRSHGPITSVPTLYST